MFFFGNSFEPRTDIPSLSGKVILITGATSGLGKRSALEFAYHKPAQLWVAARSVEKARATIEEIKKEVPDAELLPLQLELGSLESVHSAARTLREGCAGRLDIMMLNAGTIDTMPGLTADGYEIHFGTNHVGHALLTKLLLPTLLKTVDDHPGAADVRVIVLSSAAVALAPKQGIRYDKLTTKCEDMGTFTRYAHSKLANVLYARELARHYPQLTVAAIHPGYIRTNFDRVVLDDYPWLSYLDKVLWPLFTYPNTGVKNQLWASVSNDVSSGEFYFPIGVKGKGGKQARDDKLAAKLWDWTEEELKGREL